MTLGSGNGNRANARKVIHNGEGGNRVPRELTRRNFLKSGGLGLAGVGFALSLAPARAQALEGSQSSAQTGTNATYYNNAFFTDGGGQDASGRSYYFGIYRSADLVTWEQIPGGALPVDDRKNWGNDWFWAPEVYHNPDTGLYFLFYAARSDANAKKWFGFADFEEPCKVGVAVSRSPEGPFSNIAKGPIDYWPYDPDYHDVNTT